MNKYNIDIEKLCQDYLNNIPVTKLSEINNCPIENIYNRLKKSNNVDVLRKIRLQTSNVNKDKIIQEYIHGSSIDYLSLKWCKSTEYIIDVIKSSKNLDANKKLYRSEINYENKSDIEKQYWEEMMDLMFNYNLDVNSRILKLVHIETKYKGIKDNLNTYSN